MVKKSYKIFIAAVIAILFIAVVISQTGIYFETNDDRFIAEILSGASINKSDAHVVYVNYLLALPLSMLYSLTTQVPWYGGMLILLHVLTYFVLLWSVYDRCTTKRAMVLMTVVLGCFFLLNIYVTAMIQYTSTAALVALAGYACLLLQQDKKRGEILFFIMELLALLLRSQAMLMMQPIGGAVYMAVCLMEKEQNFRIRCRKILEWMLTVAIVLLIGQIGSFIGYRGEWKAYERFNEARTTMFDYYGTPAYEEVKDILNKYQVTEAEYNAFCNYVILDWEVPLECVEELAEYVSRQNEKTLDIPSLLEQIGDSWDKNNYMGINKACIWLWIAAIVWVLLKRRWWMVLPLTGLVAAHTLVLGYLLYQGRTPARVMYPLAVGMVLLLIVLLLVDCTKYRPGKWMLVLLLFIGIMWGDSCIDAGRAQYRTAKENNAGQQVFIEGAIEVREYCNQYPDNRYLLDSWSFCYYRGSALETRLYQQSNSVLTGSWYSNSPVMNRYMKEYLDLEQDNLHLIIYDTGTDEPNYTVEFLQERTGKTAELVDSFLVSHGGGYLVYQFRE